MRRENGQGSIIQRSDGRWMGRIMLNGRSTSVYGKSQTEVKNKLKEKIKNFYRDEPINVMRTTVTDFIIVILEKISV